MSLVFITQSYVAISQNIRLNSIGSINRINHSSDIDLEDLMNLYKKCTANSYSFLLNDTALASDNPLRFRNNLL